MSNRSYLLTGSNGFLGKIIYEEIRKRNFPVRDINEIFGYRIDLTKKFSFKKPIELNTVVHIAGKAHSIPKTQEQRKEFFKVNFEGTKNLCNALDTSGNLPKHFVFISTVAVYGLEAGNDINENSVLFGESPYANSKIKAEEFLKDWGIHKGVPVLILRLPLIAGPNPPGNLGKMINGIKTGKYISINNGKARRSAVLAEDVASCILHNVGRTGTYNLTDGYDPSFRELEKQISQHLVKSMPFSLPQLLGRFMGKIGDYIPGSPVNSSIITKMSQDLTFSSAKASKELNWKPRSVIHHFKP